MHDTRTMALDDLYTPDILALATAIPHIGALDAPEGEALAHARLCGSRVAAQVRLDDEGRVAEYAQQVNACALGQASAAILGQRVIGATLAELETGREALRGMLEDGVAPAGVWRALLVLERVRAVPQRHAAVLLPFDAAIAAVRNALAKREASS